MKNEIPPKRPGRKSTKLPKASTIEVGEYIAIGEYNNALMQKYGSFCYWFNKNSLNKGKKLVQRSVDGELRIYRQR